jgi:predicted permease
MSTLLYILTNILLPVFILAGVGFTMQKKFKLDIKSLVKVHLFVFMPSLIFYNIYFNKLSGDIILKVVIFVVSLSVILMIVASLVGKSLKLDKSKEKAFVNACALMNEGNYGIPLITLLYAGAYVEYAVSIQMIVVMTTSLLINTIGLYNASSGSYTGREALRNVFKLPLIYVIIIGFVFKGFSIELWSPIVSAIGFMSNAVVPMALFILGAQLAETEIKVTNPMVYLADVFRLMLSPIIALCLVRIMGIEGMIAQILIIGSALPTAVVSVALAIEFDGDYHYASQTVFQTTLFSAITVTTIIALVLRFV